MDKKKNTSNKYKNIRFQEIKDPEERKRVYKEAREQGKYKDNKSITTTANNLIPLNERPPEEAAAIRRKGAEATNRIKGEKKTAKQILDTLLPLFANEAAIENSEYIPEDIKKEILKHHIDITQYDLIMLSQISLAQNGNTKAAEFIRDTAGDKPINENHNINETITQADRDLMAKLQARIEAAAGNKK